MSTQPLPELHAGRDRWEPEGMKLVNELRRRVAQLMVGSSGVKLSYDLGNNAIGTALTTESVIWERYVPYSLFSTTFTIDLEAAVRVQVGPATFALRLGGTDLGLDGTVIGTAVVTSATYPTFGSISISTTVARGTGSVWLKLTLTDASKTSQIKSGGVALG